VTVAVSFIAVVQVNDVATVVHYFAVDEKGARRLVARKLVQHCDRTGHLPPIALSFERTLSATELAAMPK